MFFFVCLLRVFFCCGCGARFFFLLRVRGRVFFDFLLVLWGRLFFLLRVRRVFAVVSNFTMKTSIFSMF